MLDDEILSRDYYWLLELVVLGMVLMVFGNSWVFLDVELHCLLMMWCNCKTNLVYTKSASRLDKKL